jgi:Ca-activated chloride channel family protein
MIELLPRKSARRRHQATELEVLVSIQAEATAGSRRPQVNLGLVLDRSGSMHGPKLAMTLAATQQAVRRLTPEDYVSLTAFNHKAEVLVESQPALHPDSLLKALEPLWAQGETNLWEGLCAGGQQVQASSHSRRINRLVVMTDGEANCGQTSSQALCQQVEALARQGIQTTTLGFGAGYNEELLSSMAGCGQGNHYYLEDHHRVAEFFQLEVASLLATVGTEVRLELRPAPGVQVEWLAKVHLDEAGRCQLANLVLQQPLGVALRLKVAAETQEGRLLEIVLSWHCPQRGQRQQQLAHLSLPAVSAAEWERLPSCPRVEEAVAVALATSETERAMAHLRRGEAQTALTILKAATRLSGLHPSEQLRLHDLVRTLEKGDHSSGHKKAAMHGHGHGHGHAQGYGRQQPHELQEALGRLQLPSWVPGASRPAWQRVEGMLRGHFYGERWVRGPRAPLGEGASLSLATLDMVASGREFDAMELARALRNQPLLHPTNSQQKFRSRYDQGIRQLSQLGSVTAGCAALRRICPLLLIPAAGRPGNLWHMVAAATVLTHRDELAVTAALGYSALLWDLLQMDRPPAPRWYRQRFHQAIQPLSFARYRGQWRGVQGWLGSLSDFLEGPMAQASIHDWSAARALKHWGSGAYLLEQVPSALYILERHGHEPHEALREALRDTHESDTLAMLVGAAVGALHGTDLGWYLSDPIESALEQTQRHLWNGRSLAVR